MSITKENLYELFQNARTTQLANARKAREEAEEVLAEHKAEMDAEQDATQKAILRTIHTDLAEMVEHVRSRERKLKIWIASQDHEARDKAFEELQDYIDTSTEWRR